MNHRSGMRGRRKRAVTCTMHCPSQRHWHCQLCQRWTVPGIRECRNLEPNGIQPPECRRRQEIHRNERNGIYVNAAGDTRQRRRPYRQREDAGYQSNRNYTRPARQ